MDTFFGPYFHFRLELALQTWAKAYLTHSLGVYDHNHTWPSASFQWSGLSDQWMLLLTETVTVPEITAPTSEQEWFLCSLSWEGVPTKSILQPVKTAAMCYHPDGDSHPPPPILPFSLGQTCLQNGLYNWWHVAKVKRCQKASSLVKGLS